MLIPRVITALALLALLLPTLFLGNQILFTVVISIFFGAAIWETQRLFKKRFALPVGVSWGLLMAYLAWHFQAFMGDTANKVPQVLFAMSAAFWVVRILPLLKKGMPEQGSYAYSAISTMYTLTVFTCFMAIAMFYFKHSAAYLLSVMALVWIADIGAYFSGKAFGKRKLAPTISPGKSWEGAIGGGIAVLLIAAASVHVPVLADSFTVHLVARFGWWVTVALLILLVATSITGDLFESMLKRRAGMKDSSQLLPGHGGVLDRVDALVPVLPLAMLIDLL